MVTKLPARTPVSDVKSPPAAASKIVTLTISPTPKRNAFGGVLLAKAFDSLGVYSPKIFTTEGATSTEAYGRLTGTPPSDCFSTSTPCGPLAGTVEHPLTRSAKRTEVSAKFRIVRLKAPQYDSPRTSHLWGLKTEKD